MGDQPGQPNLGADQNALFQITTAMGTAIGAAIGNTAADERRSQAQNLRHVVSALQAQSRADRYKSDTVCQVLKSQADAHDWTKEHPFNPEKHSVDIWKDDVLAKLNHAFARDVIQFAGYDMYKRQSNELHEEIEAAELKLIEALQQPGNDGWGNVSCRTAFNTTQDSTS